MKRTKFHGPNGVRFRKIPLYMLTLKTTINDGVADCGNNNFCNYKVIPPPLVQSYLTVTTVFFKFILKTLTKSH